MMTDKIEFETTTYRDGRGGEFSGVIVRWDEMKRALGTDDLRGDHEEDAEIVAALIAAGAPAWVADAEGWIDEYGWGLIGPEIDAAR